MSLAMRQPTKEITDLFQSGGNKNPRRSKVEFMDSRNVHITIFVRLAYIWAVAALFSRLFKRFSDAGPLYNP